MTPRKTLITAVAMAAAASMAACSSGSGGSGGAAAGKPTSGGDLVMARASEATSLLPSVPTDNTANWVIEELYDTLAVPAQDGKSVQPSLATSWTQSADKLSWTFHLRKGVKFTNGQPVTSADVKFSIEQVQKPSSPFSFIDSIISKMDTPDPSTIVFHTKQPWAPFPSDMALYANSIVPKGYAGMSAQAFAQHPIGSGPFKLASWTKGSSMKLVKNPSYWRTGVPRLDSVTFNVVPDSNTRATQLSSGQIQINEYPSNSSIQALQKTPSVTVSTFPSSEVDYLGMNNNRKPLNDLNVRKAIRYALDKDAILKSVYYGHATPAGAYLSPTTWAHDSSIKPTPYDLTAAKAAMAKSSVPHGFTTTLTISSGDQNASAEAQLVQSDLAKIGITVKIKPLDPSTQYSTKQAGNYDMAFGLYTTDIVDPDEIARFAGTVDGGAHTVYTWFRSPQMNKLADAASGTSDQAARKKDYVQMQQIINDNVPYIPLFYVPGIYSYSKKVGGFHPGATGNYFLENSWLAK